MTVTQLADGQWAVTQADAVVAGPFATMAEGWRWIDRRSGEPLNPAERKTDWIVGKILTGAA